MNKQLLFLLLILCCVQIHAQNDVLWQKSSGSLLNKNINASDSDKLYYKLNSDFLKAKLSATTNKNSKSSTSEITIPNAEGVLERFSVWESSNFEPELQAKYPEIRAYEGRGLDDTSAKIHFSVSPIGTQTMVIRADKPIEFMEQNPDNKAEYVLFTSKQSASSKLLCKTAHVKTDNNISGKMAKTTSNNKVFKTMRLALSCTGEYTAYFGGTKAGAMAGMNATLTRVNGILNKDLAIQLVLIANNDAVIYTNASSDPYSNASTGTDGAWNTEVQSTLTSVIGEANYDIGHLFGASGGGGNANCIGCVCVNNEKGSAYTSPADGRPEGDTFDIDFVAHEIGHQLGANHTFSYDAGERTSVNVEPGSGSTIMGYAGITDYDVQSNSDDYFAYVSILQIQNNMAGKTCPVSTAIISNPPTISAGNDYTIPKGTAFILTGTGSDPVNSAVTYNWEENDNATTTSDGNSVAYSTKPDGPLFRSVVPNSSPIRYMPAYASVLQNRLTTTWESVSSIARTLHFTLTGRDNGDMGKAQTNTDEMILNVAPSAGPFAVTSQNTTNVSWAQGTFQTISWSVNGSNSLEGSSNINIKLSTDGGLTFPVILASNTPNDGSETILIPTSVVASTNCRILIEPTANIYYAVNSKAFAIGYTPTTACNSYSFGNAFSIPFSSTNYTSKTISVPSTAAAVSNVTVSINVTHTRFSDLEIQMVSPGGTIVQLFNKGCSSTDSTLALQFDDSGTDLDCAKTTAQIVFPADALAAFNGENPGGTWTLRVRDAVSGKFGTINSASINICSQTFTLGVAEPEDVAFVLYPNPNRGTFSIQFTTDSKAEVKVFVHDVLGKSVYYNTFASTSNFRQDIQLSNVSPGMYFVTVIDGDKRTVKKIIVY
jgi:subtilisin-like proprotein convertase family protein